VVGADVGAGESWGDRRGRRTRRDALKLARNYRARRVDTVVGADARHESAADLVRRARSGKERSTERAASAISKFSVEAMGGGPAGGAKRRKVKVKLLGRVVKRERDVCNLRFE